MAGMQVSLCLLAYAAAALMGGSAQITCYTEPSVAGEFNCLASNFDAVTIEECCVERNGYFFTEGGGNESCQACIVFGFFNGSEITLPEQDEATILAIGFIKGGNVQQLTAMDPRNTARFGITVAGNATEGPNADFTIQPTSFEIEGPDARVPFDLTTFVRIDGLALEAAEDFILTLEGRNNAGRAIIVPSLPGQFVDPTIRVVIKDIENATLQFLESDFSNPEGEQVIVPVVELLTGIATNLTVRIVPINISEVMDRNLLPALPTIPDFNPRAPNVATSGADFSTTPLEFTLPAGVARITIPDSSIGIIDDDINEVEQLFALILEVVDAIDPGRVDLHSGRFASLAIIFDDDPISVGFEQERYTVFEAVAASGELILIPIIKENGQESELTFEVIAILTLGSGPTAAQPDEDFDASPVIRQDFDPDVQEIDYRFELFDDTPENPDVPEPTETFQIQLVLSSEGFANVNLGGSSLFATATIVIIDDDDVIIGWEQNVTRVNESGMSLELCVRVLNLDDTVEFPGGFEVSLAANTIRGTAVDPGDYIALVNDSDLFFDIIDNDFRRTCIEVEIIDDDILEGVEFFSIEVVPDPFYVDNGNFPSNILLDQVVTFVEILDNDSVVIGFNKTEYTVLESDRVATVYVAVLRGGLQRKVSVTFSTNVLGSNNATADVDFDSLTRELTFDTNTRVIPVEITIIDDNFFEELPEAFNVSLVGDPADPVDEVIVSPDAATVFIFDVGLNFNSSVYNVGEADTNVSVLLVLSFEEGFNLSSQSIEVEFMTLNVTAQVGRDYEAVFTNITINSTVTSVSIPVINDQAVEANETFQCQITLISPTPNVVIIQTKAEVVIEDNDIVTIQFKEPEYSVMEGTQLSLGVQIIGENEIPLTVPFTINGSATFPEDFDLTPGRNQSFIIYPNIAFDPNRCLLLNLSIIDDNIALEGTESVLFELSDEESQVGLGEQTNTTVLITDGDEITVSLVDVPCTGSENDNINVSVSRSGARIASTLTLNITIELLNVTGVCGPQPSDNTDFTDLDLEIAVTFDHNDDINDTSSFILPIVDDEINEPEEIFFLSLKSEANPSAGITFQNLVLSCTVQDDDEISIHFGEENYTFQESEGSRDISLVATRSSQQEFLIAIEPEGGQNLILNATNREFKPEQGNNNSLTIQIDIVDDNAKGRNDLSQTLTLRRRLQSPPFANCMGFIQTCSSTTVNITDDDRVIIGFENPSRRVSLGEIQLCVSVMPNSIGNDFENFPLKVETTDHSARREYSIDPANDCLDDSRDTGNNNSFLLGYFNHTRQRCCFNISIVDDDNQEEMVIELNVTLSQADARSLLPIDIIPDVITVVFVDDNQCVVDTTELEGASVCYNLSNNCSGSCIIVSTAEECCGRNGTSIRLLGNDTCLEICESSPSPTDPSPSSDQSTVIIASVVASVGFILLVVVAIMTVLVVCLRRAQKTVNLNRKGEVDTLTTARYSTREGTLPVVSAGFMQTLPRSLIISASQLHLKDTLGQGEFGIVYKAFFKRYMNSETEVVAVKTLKGLFTSRDVHSLAEEVLKMQAFQHSHVMSLVGVCLDSGAGPAIVMPYMANGSLLDYLRKERDSLLLDENASPDKVSEIQKFLLSVCLQIAEGMEYLAQEKVVHRDLSARNCMIDAEGIIKVADFGLSEDVYSTNYYRQGKEDEMKLPIRWMAVESIMDGIYTEKSDVWSFGVTMWEVYSGGKLPYPGVTSSELIRHIASGGRLSKPENAACSDEVYSCMQQCWLEAADKRPHFHDLVTTISNILESIAGYLGLQRSVSLIKKVKQDYSRSPRPTRPISEMPILEEEQLEGKEGAEKEAERDSECGGGEEEKEEENEANTKTIRGGVMEMAKYETTETAI